eukprot:357392-Chlamydomonas_euryale.AAC.26
MHWRAAMGCRGEACNVRHNVASKPRPQPRSRCSRRIGAWACATHQAPQLCQPREVQHAVVADGAVAGQRQAAQAAALGQVLQQQVVGAAAAEVEAGELCERDAVRHEHIRQRRRRLHRRRQRHDDCRVLDRVEVRGHAPRHAQHRVQQITRPKARRLLMQRVFVPSDVGGHERPQWARLNAAAAAAAASCCSRCGPARLTPQLCRLLHPHEPDEAAPVDEVTWHAARDAEGLQPRRRQRQQVQLACAPAAAPHVQAPQVGQWQRRVRTRGLKSCSRPGAVRCAVQVEGSAAVQCRRTHVAVC